MAHILYEKSEYKRGSVEYDIDQKTGSIWFDEPATLEPLNISTLTQNPLSLFLINSLKDTEEKRKIK